MPAISEMLHLKGRQHRGKAEARNTFEYMAVLAAVEIGEKEATVVIGRTAERAPISILGIKRFPLNGNGSPPPDGDTTSRVSDIALELPAELDFRYALAAVPGHRVLFHALGVPFSDPKRIEQIVPLQVQDLVPFEIEDFVVDSLVVGKNPEGETALISSLVPESDVASALQRLSNIGIQPRVLTTKASALAHLPRICPDLLNGSFALLTGDAEQYSLVVFVNDSVRALREFPRVTGDEDLSLLQGEILATIRQAEQQTSQRVDRIFGAGTPRALLEALARTGISVAEMDLEQFVERGDGTRESIDRLAWTLGIFAGEEHKASVLNFRQGAYAYRARWDKVLTPLREEATYLRILGGTFLLWAASVFYDGSTTLGRINEAISEEVRKVFPQETPITGTEVSFAERQLTSVEEELRAMGSLSSLSPLGALKEITEAIPPTLKVEVDSISISSSRITFSGTVPDIPSVGRLSTALERRKGRFCDVKVDSKGKSSGSAGARFTAEIEVCE